MKVKVLKPVTYRNASNGELTSYYCGQIVTVTDEKGATMISEGLAEEYTLVVPTGSVTLTANGEYDVADKAGVVVNCSIVTVTYDPGDGTGTIDPVSVVAGDTVVLDDGSGLTPPGGQVFDHWENAPGETIESPYTVTENITLVATYKAAPPVEE